MQRSVVAHTSTYTDKPVPNAAWRAIACLFYVIPMIDSVNLGRFMYSLVPVTRIWHAITGAHNVPCEGLPEQCEPSKLTLVAT